ncbi:MAG: hypothetical protein H6492_01955 [Candidatus Paracaedibacteraceae bacterium]|nr:hypothetical protein [Candidatus Paracaedibacteraceae bacterium]
MKRYFTTALLLSTSLSILSNYGASPENLLENTTRAAAGAIVSASDSVTIPEDLWLSETTLLTWEQRLDNFRAQLCGNKRPHRNLLEERRLNTIAELLCVPVDSDAIQDRVEVDMQSDIVDTLSRLLDLLNPDRYTYDPEQIARVQAALIPQLYRLGRFRYELALEYVQLANRFTRESPPEREGPMEVSASTVAPLPPTTRAPAKKWLEYFINRYHLRNNADLPKIFNALTEFASTPRLLDQLERNLVGFLSVPHLRQLDYLRSQRFGALISTEFGLPYLLPFQNLNVQLPYTAPLETFVSEGWLSRTLISDDRTALEGFYRKFRNALEYQRLGEFVRTVLSPLEELITAPIERELSSVDRDFVCDRLYLAGGATVFDRIPKTLFQRETGEELQTTVGALRRFFPVAQLRNIALLIHNSQYLERPRDRELLKEGLISLIAALKELVPTLRRLVQEEVLLICNGTPAVLRFDIEAARIRHEGALSTIKKVGHFGSDIAIFAKLLRVLDAPLLAQFRAPLSGWSDDQKHAFVRILVMLGESAKNLSSRARMFTGTDTFWKTFEAIRDGIIHPSTKEGGFSVQRLKFYLDNPDDSHNIGFQAALTEICDVLERMRGFYGSDEFTIEGNPDVGEILDTFGDHTCAFFDRVRNLAIPAVAPSARDPERIDVTAIAFEPQTDADLAALDRTFNIAFYEEQLTQLQGLIRAHDFNEEFDALIEVLPFGEGQKRQIQALKTRYTILNSLIEEVTPLLNDEATTDTFTEENRDALSTFLTIEGVMDETTIAEMQAIVDNLPDEEPDGASDDETDDDESNPLAAFIYQSIPHPLKEQFAQFVTKKQDFYQAIEACAALNIPQTYEAFRDGLLSDEAFRHDLEEAAAIDIIDEALEKEYEANQALETRLRKFGIILPENINLWFSELKKHYGLLLNPSNQRKRTLQRLFNSTLRLQRTLEQLRDETVVEREGETEADIERYWNNPLFCLRLEGEFEELRHRVGGVSNALGIVYGVHPEIAGILQFHLENLRRLGNDLGHLGDVHGFSTQSEQGKRYYLRRTLKILMGEIPKDSISFIEVLQRLKLILKVVIERGDSAEVVFTPIPYRNGDILNCSSLDGEAEPRCFRLEMIDHDGNCGFNALGIPRERAIEQLLRHAENPDIRASVADDIRQALLQGNLPVGMRTADTHRLRTEYFHIQTQIDELRRQLEDIAPDVTVAWLQEEFLRLRSENPQKALLLKRLKKAMHAIDALNGQIDEYTHNRESYINFITQEFGRGAWLSYVRGGRGTLYALARLNHLNVHIWRENQEGRLERIPLAHGLDGEERHLLHTDGLTHFHRLRLLEEAETVSEPGPSTLHVLTARINYNFAPAAVGGGLFQGGASITLAPSSSLQGTVKNISSGLRFSTGDEWVEIIFVPSILGSQLNITPNIKRKSSDKVRVILINGGIIILKTS